MLTPIQRAQIINLIDVFSRTTKGFVPDLCNEKVVQTITFPVPRILEYIDALQEGINEWKVGLGPIPQTQWYKSIAGVEDIVALSKEEQYDLFDNLLYQTTICEETKMFKVWKSIRYDSIELDVLANLQEGRHRATNQS